MAKFNETKYQKALKTIAEQLVAMVNEDYSEDDEDGEREAALEDYTADTFQQINEAITEATNK